MSSSLQSPTAQTAQNVLRPRLGCAGIAVRGGKLLLGRRGKEPNYGKWVLPGGGVKHLETLEMAVSREFREETGLNVTPLRKLGFYELINPPGEHRVVMVWEVEPEPAVPSPSSDLLEIGFFTKNEIIDLHATRHLSPFVAKILRESGWL